MSDFSPNHRFDFEHDATNNPPTNPSNLLDVRMEETTHVDAPTGNTTHADDPMAATNEGDDLGDDFGFVDMQDFLALQHCFDELNRSHATLNQNVTALMEVVKQFIHSFQPPNVT